MTGRVDVFTEAMNRGHSAAWDQTWEQAAGFYRQALKEFPQNPKALTSLGLALYELEQYEEALKVYLQAASVSPQDPLPLEKVAQLSEGTGKGEIAVKASLRAAELYLKKGELDKAIENLSRVTRLEPANIQAHSRLVILYERLGRKQQAVFEYLALASLFQHAGETQKAIQAVNRAMQVAPQSSEAHQALAMLRESRPLPKPARSRIQTGPLKASWKAEKPASAGLPSSPPVEGVDPIAEARDRALSVLAGMVFEEPKAGEEARTAPQRGLRAIMRGSAEALFNRQSDPMKVMLHLSQAVDMQTRGQTAQAAEELEHAMQAGLDHAAAYFDLGLLYADLNRPEDAQGYLQQAVTHLDFALGARLLLGQVLRSQGRLNEAALAYLEALRLADAQVVPEEQADVLQQLYEPLIEAESKSSDAEAKARLCDNVSGLLLRADWRDRLSQARQDLPAGSEEGLPMPLGEMLTVASSSQIIESVSKIHQLARAGHLRSAMEEAFYALLYAPTYLPLHVQMGELLLQQDRLPEAIEKFSMVAQTYSARGEAGRAIDLLRRIIRVAPMDLTARGRLVEQLLARGQVEEAVREYVVMAGVYYDLADLERARKTYGEALRIANQSDLGPAVKAQILHQMADIDLQSLDWRQALQVYERIRALQPDDQRARAALVELNFRLGQESQALAELKNTLAYFKSTGQQEKAVPFLQNLANENPDQPAIRRILEDLSRA